MFDLDALIDKATRQTPKKKPAGKKKPVKVEVAVQQIIEQATAPVAVQQLIEQATAPVAVQQLIEEATAQQAYPKGFTTGDAPHSNRLLHGSLLSEQYGATKIIGRGKLPHPNSDAAFVVVGKRFSGTFDVIVFKDDEPGWTLYYSKIPKVDDALLVGENFYADRRRNARRLDPDFSRRMAKYQAKGQKQGQLGLL